jgi:zinc finger SWIM domain-containing protein 3
MDGEDDHMKRCEEYNLVVSKTFRSEEEGYRFYNDYAKVKGFSVRKEEVKYLPGTKTQFRRLYMCFKDGYHTVKNLGRRRFVI